MTTDAMLKAIASRLTARLPARWVPSAGRLEWEVRGNVGSVSLSVHKRPGRRWVCSAWTKGPRDGLHVARYENDDPVAALDGALAQLDDLGTRLAEVVESAMEETRP